MTTIKKEKLKPLLGIIWLILAILVFVLFYAFIPLSLYNETPFFVSITGAALFAFFIYKSIKDLLALSSLEKSKIMATSIIITVPTWMILTFVFWMNFSSHEGSELRENGVKVTGTILDGFSVENRKGGMYDVKIKFQTVEGKEITVNESVSENEFSRFKKGQEIELVYSKSDPNIVELLTNKSAIKKVYKTEERRLRVDDLFNLFNSDYVQMTDELERISHGWKISKDSTKIYQGQNYAIVHPEPNTIQLLSFGSEFWDFSKQLEELKFDNISSTDSTKMYDNDNFIVSLQFKRVDLKLLTITKVGKK